MSLDYQRYYEDGWKNKPDRSTPVVAEALNNIDDAIIETQEAIKGIGGKNVASAKMATGQITDAFDGSAIVTDFTKNLIKYPYSEGQSKSQNGVDITVNDDGSITLNTPNGATTGTVSFSMGFPPNNIIKLNPNKKYKVFENGVASGSGVNFVVRSYKEGITPATNTGDNLSVKDGPLILENYVATYPYIWVYKGAVLDNVTIKPMIVEIAEDETYPTEYIPTTGYDIRISGKNLIKPEYRDGEKGSAYTHKGVTYKINDDGSITANGTATGGHSYFYYANHGDDLKGLKGKTITLSGCPKGGSTSTYRQSVSDYFEDGTYEQKNDNGNGVTTTLQDGSIVNINIRIYEGYTVNDMTFYPQIEIGEDNTEFESPKLKTVHVDSKSELPVLGLETYKGVTNVISPYEISFDYPTSKDGAYILDGYSIAKQNERKLEELDSLMTTMLDKEV